MTFRVFRTSRMLAILAALGIPAFMAATRAETATSDPVGVYGVIEKVVFEPSEGVTQRIQVWGAFAFDDGQSGDGYTGVQKGYLYYTAASGTETTARREWADLKAVAGTGDGVGFGRRYRENGRVRKAQDQPASPDAYPIGFGVVRMSAQHTQPQIIARLKDALRAR